MLKRAIEYKDQLVKYENDLNNEKYLKFIYGCSYYRPITNEIEQDEWNCITRVCLSEDGHVIAYMSADIARASNRVSSMTLFRANKSIKYDTVFRNDVFKFMEYLLSIFWKISFSAYVGSKAENIYDRIIDKYNGNVVGIQKKHNRLSDGKYYDLKLYEIPGDIQNE